MLTPELTEILNGIIADDMGLIQKVKSLDARSAFVLAHIERGLFAIRMTMAKEHNRLFSSVPKKK